MSVITATAVFSLAGGIELRGNSAAMRAIAELLRGGAGKRSRVSLLHVASEPAPYDGFLEFLDVEMLSDGRRVEVEVARKGNTLHIEGSKELMKILAENIELLVDDVGRSDISEKHLHIEYHPDHYYLAESSEPLILVVTQRV